MKEYSSRRDFLKLSVGVACAAPLAPLGSAAAILAGAPSAAGSAAGHIKKAVQIDIVTRHYSIRL